MRQRYPYDEPMPGNEAEALEHAAAAVRELLDMEIVGPVAGAEATDLPAHAIAMPVETPTGTLYGNLICISANGRALDDRDARFLQVVGRLVGAQMEREGTRAAAPSATPPTAGLNALLAALEARDRYTGDHSRAVVELSVRVAGELGLQASDVEEVEQVALLHDVGKMAIPDRVLLKRGPLDELEWEAVRAHPALGARLVGSIEGLAHLAPAIRSGHERWDGTGYPDRLAGEQIPITSRITAVCDAYDAMISERPYRAALTTEAALDEVRRNAGTQFCPDAAGGLLSVFERTPYLARRRSKRRSSPPVP